MLLERDGDAITLEAPAQMSPTIRTIPGARHDAKRRLWTFPLSWGTCIAARGVLGQQLVIGPALRTWAQGERTRVDRVLALRDARDVDDAWLTRIQEVEGGA